jgi:hypothetical protein
MKRCYKIVWSIFLWVALHTSSFGQLFILNGSFLTFCDGDTNVIRCTPGFTQYKWFIEFDTTTLSTADTFAISSEIAGFYYFVTARDQNNVLLRDSILVKSFFKPIFNLGSDVFLCAGDVDTLSQPPNDSILGPVPLGGYGRLWNTGSTVTSIIAPTPGAYWLRLSRTVGSLTCTWTDTLQVIATNGPQIVPPNDTSICFGSSALLNVQILTASPPLQFNWSPAASLNSNTIQNPIATPTATTTYRLIVRDASILQCNADTAEITVTVTAPIIASITPLNPSVCPDSVLTFTGAASGGIQPYTYMWSPPIGLSTTQGQITQATASQTRTYTLTVTDSIGCTRNATSTLNVTSLQANIVQTDTTLCKSGTYQLNLSVSGGLPPYQFNWIVPPAVLSSTTIANPVALLSLINQPSLLIGRVSDQAGCRKSDSILINTRPLPTVVAVPKLDSTRIFETKTFTASATGGGGGPFTYEWSPVTINVTGVNTDVLSFTGSQSSIGERLFIVRTLDAFGCISEPDTIRIVTFTLPDDSINLESKNILYVPKFFKPSSTVDKNQKLLVFGTNISETSFSFTVYNRWGSILFQSTNLNEMQEKGWDGTEESSGVELPQGSYVYIIEGKFEDGSSIREVGSSMLVK